jgi:hypothetical protein
MNKSAAGGHDDSPHLIIRIAERWDFSAWYRACPGKNWPRVQEAKEINEVNEVKEVKEVKESASNLG